MFELPELITLARQMNDTLRGRTIRSGQLGNSHEADRVVDCSLLPDASSLVYRCVGHIGKPGS